MVVASTHTKSIQKQIRSIDVDKVGSKKPLARKSSLFLVELIASSFLNLISTQARLECRCKRVLLIIIFVPKLLYFKRGLLMAEDHN